MSDESEVIKRLIAAEEKQIEYFKGRLSYFERKLQSANSWLAELRTMLEKENSNGPKV